MSRDRDPKPNPKPNPDDPTSPWQPITVTAVDTEWGGREATS